MKEFNDFVFNKELETKLKNLTNNSGISIFYGFEGNGKTTFSKYLSEKNGDSLYIDIGKYLEKGKTVRNLKKDIKTFINCYAPCGTVIILDDFHKIVKRKQHMIFKIMSEYYSGNKQCLFILCVNVEKGGYLGDVISPEALQQEILPPGVFSIFDPISFNTKKTDIPDLTQRVKDKFPMLDTNDIKNCLPDMRQIQRMVAMS